MKTGRALKQGLAGLFAAGQMMISLAGCGGAMMENANSGNLDADESALVISATPAPSLYSPTSVNYDDFASASAADAEGNVFLGGSRRTGASLNVDTANVVKINAAGGVAWEVLLPGDRVQDVTLGKGWLIATGTYWIGSLRYPFVSVLDANSGTLVYNTWFDTTHQTSFNYPKYRVAIDARNSTIYLAMSTYRLRANNKWLWGSHVKRLVLDAAIEPSTEWGFVPTSSQSDTLGGIAVSYDSFNVPTVHLVESERNISWTHRLHRFNAGLSELGPASTLSALYLDRCGVAQLLAGPDGSDDLYVAAREFNGHQMLIRASASTSTQQAAINLSNQKAYGTLRGIALAPGGDVVTLTGGFYNNELRLYPAHFDSTSTWFWSDYQENTTGLRGLGDAYDKMVSVDAYGRIRVAGYTRINSSNYDQASFVVTAYAVTPTVTSATGSVKRAGGSTVTLGGSVGEAGLTRVSALIRQYSDVNGTVEIGGTAIDVTSAVTLNGGFIQGSKLLPALWNGATPAKAIRFEITITGSAGNSGAVRSALVPVI